MQLEERVFSPHPPAEVWARVGDFSRLAEWDPGVARVDRVGTGPVAVGARYVVHVRVGPWTSPMTYVVEQLEPARVVLRGRSGLFEAVDDVSVAPDGQGSLVTWRATLSPAGWLAFTEPLWRPGFRRVADAAMAGLRRWLA